jgi:hypothetical protein
LKGVELDSKLRGKGAERVLESWSSRFHKAKVVNDRFDDLLESPEDPSPSFLLWG